MPASFTLDNINSTAVVVAAVVVFVDYRLFRNFVILTKNCIKFIA